MRRVIVSRLIILQVMTGQDRTLITSGINEKSSEGVVRFIVLEKEVSVHVPECRLL